MSTEKSCPAGPTATPGGHRPHLAAGIFDEKTGIYRSIHETLTPFSRPNPNPNPNFLDTASLVLSHFPPPHRAESLTALIDASTGQRVTYAALRRSALSLASGLRDALGIRKGDVVFLLSPNSVLYPAICLAVLTAGAVLTTANPLNTAAEIATQLADSAAKLAITAPDELPKVVPTGVPTILTSRDPKLPGRLSVEALIEIFEPVEPDRKNRRGPADAAAILYSSGTTGRSKGVVLTHANVTAVVTLLRWSMAATRARGDVFLCFVPMFHVYGLVFFGLGLFCCRTATVVIMRRFEIGAALAAVEAFGVTNVPAVPAVVLAMVKVAGKGGAAAAGMAGLRRVGSGAAPLSKEVVDEFRLRLVDILVMSFYKSI